MAITPFPFSRKYKASRKRGLRKVKLRRLAKTINRKKPVVAIGKQVNHAFPRMMKFTHRYVEVLSLTSTAGVPNVLTMSCNGMFDPNYTGGGRQPMAFDNLTALYDHYTVIGSKIRVKCTPVSTTNPASYLGIYLNDDTTVTPSNAASFLANTASFSILPTGGSLTKTLSAKWSARKMFGKSVLENPNLRGDASANPTEATYWTIFFGALDEASNTGAAFTVDIEYIAIWTEPKDINLS